MSWMNSLSLCLLFGPAQAPDSFAPERLAVEAGTTFDEAMQAQSSRERRAKCLRAAALYERLFQHGIDNADFQATLGDAYFAGGELPRAILCYRRGLRFDPNDAVLQKNLALARQRVAYNAGSDFGRPPVDRWPPWLPRPGLEHVQFALIYYGLGWFCVTLWRMTRRRGYVLFSALAFAAFFLVVLGFALEVSKDRRDRAQPLVVVAQDGLILRKGNGPSYPVVNQAPVNRGVEGRLRFERGDWLQLELSGGEIGWAPRSAVLVDAWP